VLLHDVSGDTAKARATVDRLRNVGACGKELVQRQECRVATWEGVLRNDPAAAWQAASTLGCAGTGGEVSVLAYHAALRCGHDADAGILETNVREHARLYGDDDPALGAVVAHLEGARLAVAGDARGAAQRFAAADAGLLYWGDNLGLMKLFNRLELARALRLSGETAKADAILAEVKAVNADFAARFADAPFFAP